MEIKNKVKYPCGHEIEQTAWISPWSIVFGGEIKSGFDNEDGCPIHGKKCKK